MRFSPALVSGVLATAAKALQSGSSSSDSDDWTNNSTKPIELVPAPWALHGTVYSLATLLPPATLPAKAYGPLERASPAYVGAAEYVGLLGMIQIIRYTDSPVGPYDELLLVPGYFKYPHIDAEGRQTERLNPSITRIYVSQKYTAKNGRLNWNIPKHLAKFDWTESADGSTTVKVYPFDTAGAGPTRRASPAPRPCPFPNDLHARPGGLPFSTDLAHGELAGTDRWRAVVPGQASARSSLGLFDMDQGRGDQVGDTGRNAVGDEFFPNFWPNTPRLTLGLRMDNAKISFGEPEIWG
ncbi:hypothetical protein PG990_007144 [Apiospora arundinis]